MTLEHRRYGSAVTVLVPEEGAGYPRGGTVVVSGRESTLVIDPSLALDSDPAGADAVMISHGHEDHLAGLRHFADSPVYGHHADIAAIRSPEVLLEGFGYPPAAREEFVESVLHQFRLVERDDATAIEQGHRFDLGGVTATVVHLPGHTAGHCGLLIEPDGFFYIADIDLTSFGPYYADLGSSLAGFRSSIDAVADVEAQWYGTFHQKGVIAGRDEVRERLHAYAGVIDRREQALLDMLVEPQSIEQIIDRRLVFRPTVQAPHVATVERATAERHLDILLRDGRAVEVEPGIYRSVRG